MGKIKIDFDVIPTFDTKKIVVVDSSKWEFIENKPSIVEIIIPGETEPITHYYTKNAVNIFNSFNLGLNCEGCPGEELHDLPDGIYHIKVIGSPDTFYKEKHFIRTENTRLKLDEVVDSMDLNCSDLSKSVLEKVNKIKFFIDASESKTRLGNYCEAQECLFRAQKMLSKLKGCNKCV